MEKKYTIEVSEDCVEITGTLTVREAFDFLSFFEKEGFTTLEDWGERTTLYLRMEAYQSKETENQEGKKYDFRIEDCSESLMKELANYMTNVGVDFKVLDIKTGQFVEIKDPS